MSTLEKSQRRLRATEDLSTYLNRHDAAEVVEQLDTGLTLLRDLLFIRIHNDVEREFGMDSMLAPISEESTERRTKAEIETYQVVVAAAACVEYGYVEKDEDWVIDCFAHLRFGDKGNDPKLQKRIAYYRSKQKEQRPLMFMSVLENTLREVRRAPMVLFRLFPLSVRLTTALAFNDTQQAIELRKRQIDLLPAIKYCNECGGQPLEAGQHCRHCSNPVWEYKWLLATD